MASVAKIKTLKKECHPVHLRNTLKSAFYALVWIWTFFLLIDLPMCLVFYTAQHFRFCSYCTHVVGWTDECSGSITDVWIRIKQAGYSNLSAHSSATCLSCCWLMPCWVEAYWALMAMPLHWGLIGPGSGEGEGSNRSCHDKQALSRRITQEWWCKII